VVHVPGRLDHLHPAPLLRLAPRPLRLRVLAGGRVDRRQPGTLRRKLPIPPSPFSASAIRLVLKLRVSSILSSNGLRRTISSQFGLLYRFVVKSVALTHRLSGFDCTCSFSSSLINPCVTDLLNLEQLFLAAQARAAGLLPSDGSGM
jgi:hypothetical protein